VARIGERRLLRRQQRLDVRRGGVEGAGDDRDLVVAAIPVLLSVNEIVKSVGGSLGDRDMEIWILEFLDRLDAARAYDLFALEAAPRLRALCGRPPLTRSW
jgi:hypothetical protein